MSLEQYLIGSRNLTTLTDRLQRSRGSIPIREFTDSDLITAALTLEGRSRGKTTNYSEIQREAYSQILESIEDNTLRDNLRYTINDRITSPNSTFRHNAVNAKLRVYGSQITSAISEAARILTNGGYTWKRKEEKLRAFGKLKATSEADLEILKEMQSYVSKNRSVRDRKNTIQRLLTGESPKSIPAQVNVEDTEAWLDNYDIPKFKPKVTKGLEQNELIQLPGLSDMQPLDEEEEVTEEVTEELPKNKVGHTFPAATLGAFLGLAFFCTTGEPLANKNNLQGPNIEVSAPLERNVYSDNNTYMIAEASPEEIQRDIIEAELYNLGIDPESIRSPLQSTKTRKTSGFGQRTLRGETKMHTGIDLVSSNNQNLVAMSDGIVCRQFARPLRLLMNEGYGHQFIGTMDINGAPHTYEYSHTEKTALEEFRQSKTVEREDLPEHLKAYVDCREVEKGTELGIMGNTGSSTGTHLHAEIRDATRKRINPETIFTHLVDLNVLEEEIRESDEEDSTES